MNENIKNTHKSYKTHRKQFWLQILLPMLAVTILIVFAAVLVWLTPASGEGNSVRWAAISTIWLVIPALIFGLLFLIILIGFIYVLARLIHLIPPYSSKAQEYISRGAKETKKVSNMAVRPVLFLEGIVASLKAVFRKH